MENYLELTDLEEIKDEKDETHHLPGKTKVPAEKQLQEQIQQLNSTRKMIRRWFNDPLKVFLTVGCLGASALLSLAIFMLDYYYSGRSAQLINDLINNYRNTTSSPSETCNDVLPIESFKHCNATFAANYTRLASSCTEMISDICYWESNNNPGAGWLLFALGVICLLSTCGYLLNRCFNKPDAMNASDESSLRSVQVVNEKPISLLFELDEKKKQLTKELDTVTLLRNFLPENPSLTDPRVNDIIIGYLKN